MDSLFFWFSKLVWLLISPDTVIFVWLCAGIFLLWLRKNLWGRRILTGLAATILFIGLFPVGEWILGPLENRYPPNPTLENVDGIIVLAGPESASLTSARDQVVLSDAAERNLNFMRLARQFPGAQLIFSGGSGSLLGQEFKAADVAKRLFSEQALDISRITFERDSRNTYENALFSKALINPQSNQRWVLITTSWHMPRSMAVFCKVGWAMTPYPVDFQTRGSIDFRINWDLQGSLRLISVGIKERIGLVAYRVTGKSC